MAAYMNIEAAIQIIHKGANTVQTMLTILNNRAANSADFPEISLVATIPPPSPVKNGDILSHIDSQVNRI